MPACLLRPIRGQRRPPSSGVRIARTGAPRHPRPAEYGQEHAVDHRYAARCDRGLGARRMQSAQDDPDLPAARLGSPIAPPKRLRRITARSRDAHSHRSRFPVAGAGTAGRRRGGGLAMDAGHPVRRQRKRRPGTSGRGLSRAEADWTSRAPAAILSDIHPLAPMTATQELRLRSWLATCSRRRRGQCRA